MNCGTNYLYRFGSTVLCSAMRDVSLDSSSHRRSGSKGTSSNGDNSHREISCRKDQSSSSSSQWDNKAGKVPSVAGSGSSSVSVPGAEQ